MDEGGSAGPVAASLPAVDAPAMPEQIALLVPPRISNLDEFEPLAALQGVQLVAVRDAGMRPTLSSQDWIILPGSKHTSTDLAWLRRQGLDVWVKAHAARGGRVLGICGGLQILGRMLLDPLGLDGSGEGLGLLPLQTRFEHEKVLRHCSTHFETLPGAWAALSGVPVAGYEIHQGRTMPMDAADPVDAARDPPAWPAASAGGRARPRHARTRSAPARPAAGAQPPARRSW